MSSAAHSRTRAWRCCARSAAWSIPPALYPNLSATELLEIGRRIKGLPRSESARVLELVELTPHARERIAGFSLGMRQRLALAHAMLGGPRLLILDEPGNGLDPQGMRDIRALLAALPARTGCTVFLSSHQLDEVEKIATHVAVLHGGRVLCRGSGAAPAGQPAGQPGAGGGRRQACPGRAGRPGPAGSHARWPPAGGGGHRCTRGRAAACGPGGCRRGALPVGSPAAHAGTMVPRTHHDGCEQGAPCCSRHCSGLRR
ncbi:ATP-binding cassette domain-containing protein [Massilia sp. Dwa41.01b]|nr:ATP-binding cassette domain-containing protein [Massilia sp. Dwa41.01b]